MKTSVLPSTLLAAALLALLHATPAHAQPARVFVGGHGSDSNACTFPAPCRTFQHAHDSVASGGEIDVLDPAGYGLLTITKSISIQGHGYAGIASDGSGDVITINAGPSDAVNLRGLLIDGVGHGFSGIRVISVGALTVQDTLIRNFTGDGINFVSSVSGTTRLYVTDTRIFDVGVGINIDFDASGSFRGVLNRVEVNNGTGINLGTGAAGATVNVEIKQCVFTAGGAGLLANPSLGTIVARMTRTTIANNGTGYNVAGGATVTTYGDNNISDNGSNLGSLTPDTHQ
jgi:hypothetical protein